MKLDPDLLRPVLVAAACGQLAIAMINLRLDRLLGWRAELDTLSLLLREVFFIHKWFRLATV